MRAGVDELRSAEDKSVVMVVCGVCVWCLCVVFVCEDSVVVWGDSSEVMGMKGVYSDDLTVCDVVVWR